MIGLAGAHRTGKTTMAKRWAVHNGIPYVPIPKVLASLGMEPKDINTLDKRIYVQRRIIEAAQKVWMPMRGVFIADRTPLDIAAYTMGDISQEEISREDQKQLMTLVSECIELTNVCFGGILVVPPAIPFVPEPGKPLPNLAYQELIHTLITGIASDPRMTRPWFDVPRQDTDINVRLKAINEVYSCMAEDLQEFHNERDGVSFELH